MASLFVEDNNSQPTKMEANDTKPLLDKQMEANDNSLDKQMEANDEQKDIFDSMMDLAEKIKELHKNPPECNLLNQIKDILANVIELVERVEGVKKKKKLVVKDSVVLHFSRLYFIFLLIMFCLCGYYVFIQAPVLLCIHTVMMYFFILSYYDNTE